MYNSAPLTVPDGRVYRLHMHLADRPHLLIAGATGSAGLRRPYEGRLYHV